MHSDDGPVEEDINGGDSTIVTIDVDQEAKLGGSCVQCVVRRIIHINLIANLNVIQGAPRMYRQCTDSRDQR